MASPLGAPEQFSSPAHSQKDHTALSRRSVPHPGTVATSGHLLPLLCRLSPGAGAALASGPTDIPPITALPAGAAPAGCPGRCHGTAPNSWRPVNTALIWMLFFPPLQPLQSKDYLLHTHAAALFCRIDQCSPLLPEKGPAMPERSWPFPGQRGLAPTPAWHCPLSPWPLAPWCPVPSGSSRPWGFFLSG